MRYNIELSNGKEVEVPEQLQDKIIKDYLMTRYHWVIGISMFMIGFLIGILAN